MDMERRGYYEESVLGIKWGNIMWGFKEILCSFFKEDGISFLLFLV